MIMDINSRQRSYKNVLVFGASGYIGTNLVPKLIEQGYTVRACARNKAVLTGRAWTDVELIEADALKPATLDAALSRHRFGILSRSLDGGRASIFGS